MREARDEKFKTNYLKAIRFTFIIQTIGLIAVLIYDGVKNGVTSIVNNPLWIVLLLTVVVFSILYFKISKLEEEYDDDYYYEDEV